MKVKSFMRVFTMLLVFLMVISCGGDKKEGDQAAEGTKESGKKKIRIAIVHAGFLGDKSFNDSANEGIKKAMAEYDIEVKTLESKVPSDWETNVVSMASEGYDLVIGNSSQFQDIIKKHAPEFPNVKFAIIDTVVNEPNVMSVVFAQNEGSFLAGAAAALFTQKTDIPNVNPEKTIGWVGGMDIPVLQDFLTGYKQGAAYIDPETKVLVSFAGTFNDPLKGKELALAQYSQGADIIMNVASNTGNGVLEAAKDSNKYAIGVDINQDDIYPGFIFTSMLKRVDVGTYEVIKSVVEDKFKGGEILKMDVANGGIGLTDMSVMKQALGDKFPEDILTRIGELTEKIKSGEIKVESYPGFKFE
ncbi:BMP family protein [Sebaldella sp. S0638]|uniref:BMP family lipoprotein n=1 Tax=Sebaldella sp. S0638 TaxID=2957809 RepID=UPI0020A1324F|nr:BMP family ABC transporter substrate-binding protein [Sebaldella sp. S0638]MCP1225969.1 BMP family ABC transporter substrate-binding protein [Sebaldella sp. S0638]